MENTLEVSKPEQIEAQTRAEVDIAISTAKRYPRNMMEAVKNVHDLATMDQETAESCFYAVPRDGKTIEGESIRFAEIVAQSWGNMKFGTRIVGNDGKKITAQAIVHDLERNIFASCEVDRKITKKDGRTFSEDMVIITGNAAKSIALRNAILQVVPKGLFSSTIDKIKDVAIGKALDFQKTKDKALKYFRALNVKDEEICTVLQISNVDEIERDHVLTLRGLVTAIKDGDTTIEQTFRPAKAAPGNLKPAENNVSTVVEIFVTDIKAAKTKADIDAIVSKIPDNLKDNTEIVAAIKAKIESLPVDKPKATKEKQPDNKDTQQKLM